MERHHMRMAVGVITEIGDRLSNVADQTQTAFDKRRDPPAPLREVEFTPASVARRMHTLVLIGSLDRGTVRQLETEIERLCEEGVTGITLDLRELTYIDAIGVAVVAFRCGLCLRRGYDFALIRGPRTVQRAFEHAGLSELLPFSEERAPLGQQARLAEESVASDRDAAEPGPLVLAPPLEPVASGHAGS
jgi:anti-anti-sigma factor